MTLPLVSVIITNYNYAQYVEKAINSVFNQTYQNMEVIVINDGSTDDSDAVILKAIADKQNVMYINRENKGVVQTRNEGLAQIKGDLFIFLDADNYWSEDYLEKLYLKLIQTHADVVYADLRQLNTKGDLVNLTQFPNFSIERLLCDNFVDMSALAKADIGKKYQFDSYLNNKSHEDWDFWLNIALDGYQFVKCENNALNYLLHVASRNENGNVSSRKWQNLIQTFDYIWRKYALKYPTVYKENEWSIQHSKMLYDLLLEQSKSENYLKYLQKLSEEKITIFYKRTQYSKEYSEVFNFETADEITVKVPSQVTEIRVDLTEVPGFYDQVLLLDENDLPIEPIDTNGLRIEEKVYFIQQDPAIFYRIENTDGRTLRLKYQMSDLMAFNQDTHPLKILYRKNLEVINDYSQLADRYESLEIAYQAIITSKIWKWRTKLFRLFNRIFGKNY